MEFWDEHYRKILYTYILLYFKSNTRIEQRLLGKRPMDDTCTYSELKYPTEVNQVVYVVSSLKLANLFCIQIYAKSGRFVGEFTFDRYVQDTTSSGLFVNSEQMEHCSETLEQKQKV